MGKCKPERREKQEDGEVVSEGGKRKVMRREMGGAVRVGFAVVWGMAAASKDKKDKKDAAGEVGDGGAPSMGVSGLLWRRRAMNRGISER